MNKVIFTFYGSALRIMLSLIKLPERGKFVLVNDVYYKVDDVILVISGEKDSYEAYWKVVLTSR